MKKIKTTAYEIAILLACVGGFLTVGAVENFSIGIGRGLLIIGGCAIVGAVATVMGCRE